MFLLLLFQMHFKLWVPNIVLPTEDFTRFISLLGPAISFNFEHT